MIGGEAAGADGASGVTGEGIPHKREDGELVGWIHADGDDWTAVDVLGRVVVRAVDWLAAEESLEERGLAFLADPWTLEREQAPPLRVRLVEVTPERIVVKAEDYGDVSHASERIVLPWPLPDRLRPPRPGDPDGFTLHR